MKILIAYATKTGCCEICANELASFLKFHNVDICDIAENTPNLDNYDLSIIGGSIRFGKLDKRVYSFISKNKEKLKNTKTAFYICNACSEETDRYFSKCFPQGVTENAVIFESFGGELKIDKQKGFDRLVVKMILKENEENESFSMPNIQTDAIGRFADKLKNI